MFVLFKDKLMLFILVVYFFTILWVTPSSLLAPTFWGEEGNVYFKFAYEHDWLTTLVSPHLGYYSFFANITAILAVNLLPIEYSPFVTAYMTLGIFILLGLLVVLPNSPFQTWQQQSLVLLAIVFLPPVHAQLSTLLGHFYFAVFTLLILTSNTNYHRINVLNRILLGCAGLTGSVSIFFVPAYWISFVLQRSKERLIQSSILSFCATVQVVVFLFDLSIIYPDGYRVSRFSNFEVDVFIFTMFNRFLVANLMGYENMIFFGKFLQKTLVEKNFLYWSLFSFCTISLSSLGFLLFKNSTVFLTRALLFCFFIVTVLSYLSSTDAGFHPAMGISKVFLLYGNAPRYFYLPNLILFMWIILSTSMKQINKFVFYPIIYIVLSVAIHDQSNRFNKNYNALKEGYSWKNELLIWKNNPDYYLKSPPRGVVFQLKSKGNFQSSRFFE